jgi:hypothetical protein
MRNITQICAGPNSENLICLCDDGTLWTLYHSAASWKFKRMPDVPQAGVEATYGPTD